jgi:MFS family permease
MQTEHVVTQKPAFAPGSARAALAQPAYRRMYLSGFASQIGSWMQTVVIGPYALLLSGGKSSFVAYLMAAQLGPLLLLSIPGGALAGRIRQRKQYMINMQLGQIACAVFLAIAAATQANKWLVFLGVLGGGIGNALNAPLYQSVLPELVGRANIAGAVSLGSAQINGSRVIAPIVLAALSLVFNVTPTMVFGFNAVSFLSVIWALTRIDVPGPPARRDSDATGFAVLAVGIRETRSNPVAQRVLSIMFLFSFACLAYVTQFPSISESMLQLNSNSSTYKLMFATWGTGALCGALSMSTVLAKVDKKRVPQWLLLGFAFMTVIWSTLRSVSPVLFAVLFVLGFCYFGTTTALNTVLQEHLTPRNRPYVMSLWFMSFGGTVPLAGFWAGWVMDSRIGSLRGAVVVLLVAAAVSVLLAFTGDLRRVATRTAPEVPVAG